MELIDQFDEIKGIAEQVETRVVRHARTITCNATVLVNMRDIEAPKEDDGFEGAFLSP